MFLIKPDKLDIKRYLSGFRFIMHFIRFNGKKTAKQSQKADAILLELADVAIEL